MSTHEAALRDRPAPRGRAAAAAARTIDAVIFDWAGTTVDCGSIAPVAAFVEVFRARGVSLSVAEARGPMGVHKRAHLEALLREPAIADRFRRATGRLASAEEIDAMYAELVPLTISLLPYHAAPIPGVLEAIATLRARGIKIGSTTGYTRDMMDVLAPEAARRGFRPDAIVTSSDVAEGRPSPAMCLRNALDLRVAAVSSCVKVDDTPVGIEEGLRAGMWTVGVAMTGNEAGLDASSLAALPTSEREAVRARAHANLRKAGAHAVIDAVADLVPIVDRFRRHVAAGERP